MDIKKLKAFIELAKKEGVSKLRYADGKEHYFVSFVGDSLPVAPRARSHEAQAEVAHQAHSTPKKSDYYEITSPFVGTFYRAPSPGALNYSNVGDRVSPGKILCIIEAMKIMNEIESDVAGEIVEICVENESYVEFGQVLFRVKN